MTVAIKETLLINFRQLLDLTLKRLARVIRKNNSFPKHLMVEFRPDRLMESANTKVEILINPLPPSVHAQVPAESTSVER